MNTPESQIRWIQRRQYFNLVAVLAVGVGTLVSANARGNESERITTCIQDYAERNADYQRTALRYAKEDRDVLIAQVRAQRAALVDPDRTSIARFVAAQDSYLATLERNDEKRKSNPAPDPPSEACQ